MDYTLDHGSLKRAQSIAYPVRWKRRAIRLLLGFILPGLLLPLILEARKVGPANFIVDHDEDLTTPLCDRAGSTAVGGGLGFSLQLLRRALVGVAREEAGTGGGPAQPGRRVAVDLGHGDVEEA